MRRSFAVLATAMVIAAGASRVSAEDVNPEPGTVEVTVIPGGGTFFPSRNGAADFASYTLGGSLTYNFKRTVGLEGEIGSSLGIAQDLGTTAHVKTPNTVDYSGNLVVYASSYKSLVPYATGGVGATTMLSRASLALDGAETFLSGNVGGGVRWYAPSGRWGVRGDYRFIGLRGKDDAPSFFGSTDRYAHRVYAGVIINAIR